MKNTEHYLFYCDNANNAASTITLDENEAGHAVSVLRIKPGRQMQITNGNGTIYDCLCVDATKRQLSCQVISKTIIPKTTPELTLLVGLPDKEPFETVLEHATALGVSRIAPLVMDHCRKPWWELWEKSRERFKTKMIASMKQCLYPYIPQLDAPSSLRKAVDMCENSIIVADQHGEPLRDANISAYSKITCLVGPPGGISSNEYKLLESCNSLFVKIAKTRLKTELAAVALCSRVVGL